MSEVASTPYAMVARAGDTFTRVVVWTEDDGTAINLAGASLEWSLVSGSTETKYEDTTEASITGAASGEVTLALTPTQTRALFGALWRYEATVTMPDASRQTLLFGLLSVEREVFA